MKGNCRNRTVYGPSVHDKTHMTLQSFDTGHSESRSDEESLREAAKAVLKWQADPTRFRFIQRDSSLRSE